VTEGTPIMDVASLFSEKKINRAPVVDKKGVMIGIVSRADALRWSLVPEDR